MKLLVETKDNLQVVGNGDEMWARYNRPSVMRQTNFADSHISGGTLKLLAQLNDDASDAEFAEHWLACEGNAEKQAALKTDYARDYAPDAKPKGDKAPKPEPKPDPKPAA